MSEEFDPTEGLFAPEEPVVETPPAGETPPVVEEPKAVETPPEVPATGDAPKAEEEPKMVPKAALDEARTQLRETRELLATRSKGEETQSAPEAPSIRNPSEDLPGALEDVMGNVHFNMLNQNLNFSERMARKEHGKELIDKVRTWALERFEADPEYAAKIVTADDPYEIAIEDYNLEQRSKATPEIAREVLRGLSDEEAELLRAHRASKTSDGSTVENRETNPPRDDKGKFAPQEPPRRKVDEAPRSIASDPGGRSAPVVEDIGEGAAFDAAFK